MKLLLYVRRSTQTPVFAAPKRRRLESERGERRHRKAGHERLGPVRLGHGRRRRLAARVVGVQAAAGSGLAHQAAWAIEAAARSRATASFMSNRWYTSPLKYSLY